MYQSGSRGTVVDVCKRSVDRPHSPHRTRCIVSLRTTGRDPTLGTGGAGGEVIVIPIDSLD